MKQTTVNVRELKARLSHYLRLAEAGEAVDITERGVPIGRIVPTAAPIEDRIDAMARSGLLQWDERRLPACCRWGAPAARSVWPICWSKIAIDRLPRCLALVKRYVAEVSSDDVASLIEVASVVGTSIVSRAEVAAVFAKASRMQIVTRDEAEAAVRAFGGEWTALVRDRVVLA